MKYACNCLKHQNNPNKYFHNFEAGQRGFGFGQSDGKMYYKIQNDISKKYSGTGPRVIVTLGPTPYSQGPVPCSEARTWGVRFKCYVGYRAAGGFQGVTAKHFMTDIIVMKCVCSLSNKQQTPLNVSFR